MIISFCGNAGAGKSTVAKKVAEKLGWPYYYMGGLRRQRAKERGLTIEEYNKLGESDPATDFEVDEYQKELAEREDNFIIDGRTSWYFIPRSFKIFMDVDEKIGAERILHSLRKENSRNETSTPSEAMTLEEMISLNRKRKASDDLRYKQYYNIDVFNTSNFDLVIDTTHINPEQTFDQVWAAVSKIIPK